VFDPRATELIAVALFRKSVHLNRPGKKHSSSVGLPMLAATKIKKDISWRIESSVERQMINVMT